MNPIAFKLGSIVIYWYGIIIVISVLAGAYVSSIQARRRGENPERVWDALLICLILGIVGARVYHVFSVNQGGMVGWPYYRQNPAAILRIWEGGLGLLGAIAGGALGMVIYTRLARLSTALWLDIAAYGLFLGQAIGRWGNYINQELYGPPTTLPWGIPIQATFRMAPFNNLAVYPLSTRFHPLFLYESLWCLIGLALLWWLDQQWSERMLPGDRFAFYVMWYSLGRFGIEFLRPDAWMWGAIAAAQVFTLLAFAVALGLTIYRHVRRSTPPQDAPAEPAPEATP